MIFTLEPSRAVTVPPLALTNASNSEKMNDAGVGLVKIGVRAYLF
jgi:hypothetical protein